MLCTVSIFPDVITRIRFPLVDKLIIVRTPSVTTAKGIILLIICIVYVLNRNRHKISAHAQVSTNKSKIACKVVDIASSSAPSSLSMVIPIAFNSAVIGICDIENRTEVFAAVRRGKSFVIGCCSTGFFNAVRELEHHAGIDSSIIPTLYDTRDIPNIPPNILNLCIVLDNRIISRPVCPLQVRSRPGFQYLMDIDL